MKILVTGRSMCYLSGQPLYCYELCRELKRKGHDVTMLSEWEVGVVGGLTGAEGHKLKENLDEIGVKRLNWTDKVNDGDYDLCLANEDMSAPIVRQIPNTPVINIIHSEYQFETPLPDSPQIVAYVCIRYSIMRHIIEEHQIPEAKCHVIYNGVDRNRFKGITKPQRDYRKVVVPCTLDTMREAFLNKVIDEANEKNRVELFGMDCGAKLHQNPYATIHPDKFNIEEDIRDADEVAGILLGRVNLEAWSCGIPSRVYDPDTLDNRLYDVPADFDKNHNIENVVKKLIALVGNLDDITIVIPHHTARAELKNCLDSIANMRNVIIVKGGSFARNVNKGMSFVETPYAVILNDDTTFVPQLLLRRLVYLLNEFDIVGAVPDNGCKGFSIIDGRLIETDQDARYPSGALLMVKVETWNKLKGFNENYVNGCEDVDLYLRAEKAGMKVTRCDMGYHHDCESSDGRFDHFTENIKLFNKTWKGVCQIQI